MENVKESTIKEKNIKELAPQRAIESPTELCMACGSCSAGCPITGQEGYDPRKIIAMVNEGRDEELIDSKLPWLCTMCAKCEHACPMGINIIGVIRTIRGLVDRDKVPGMIHKGVELCLQTGNNIGLPAEDFDFIIEDVGEEVAEEEGFEEFAAPIDKENANILHTLHNKLVNTQNEDLVHWWKIFHAANESFTMPSENWEGVNWGLFSGDDESMKTVVGRIVTHMEKLKVKNLMYPE